MSDPNALPNNLPVPQDFDPALAAQQVQELAVNPPAPEMRSLNAEGATRFVGMMQEHFAGMDSIMSATRGQSLDAMEVASLSIDMVAEALQADPDGYAAISHNGSPLADMARAANSTHSHQTGQTLPGARFLGGTYTNYEGALTLLSTIKEKMRDQRLDGTTHVTSKVDATAAHGRKDTAIAATRALQAIAAARGGISVSAATVDKMTPYMEKPAPKF